MQERNVKSGKVELMIDGVHFYILVGISKKPHLCLGEVLFNIVCHPQGSVDSQNLLSEQRTRYHVEAKMAPDGNPIILSANVTRSLGGKTSFAATVKNVLRQTASLSGAWSKQQIKQ